MFDAVAVNVVISLVFIYSLYSLLVTTLNEGIASLFNLRAKTLEKGIKRMLTDNGDKVNAIVNAFYQQPIIKFLGEDNTKKPAYLTSKTFSNALVHLCSDFSELKTNPQQQLFEGIQKIKEVNPETGTYLEMLYHDAGGKRADFQKAAEDWFNETMDRATGWYKKQTQKITLLVAFIIALSFNVDTIGIVKNLSVNPKQAIEVVEIADKYFKVNSSNPTIPINKEADVHVQTTFNNAKAFVASTSALQKTNAVLGLGWKFDNQLGFGQLASSILGLLITTIAISLGAPFWFDLLSKLMQLRGSKKIEETIPKPM